MYEKSHGVLKTKTLQLILHVVFSKALATVLANSLKVSLPASELVFSEASSSGVENDQFQVRLL